MPLPDRSTITVGDSDFIVHKREPPTSQSDNLLTSIYRRGEGQPRIFHYVGDMALPDDVCEAICEAVEEARREGRIQGVRHLQTKVKQVLRID